MDEKVEINPEIKVRLARLVAKTVAEAMRDPQTRAKFSKWYFEKYGKRYRWKYKHPRKRGEKA